MISTGRMRNFPLLRLGAGVYRGFKFLKRAIYLRLKLTQIDKKSPFKGKLAANGVASFTISSPSIEALCVLKDQNSVDESEPYGNVSIPSDKSPLIKEIFDVISEEVRLYLGPDAYLDGINWMNVSPKSKSISENWHTDNVGNRLKLFICVNGDGSLPTHVIPSEHRIPSRSEWFAHTIRELIRWVGYENSSKDIKEITLKHRKGTMFMFDTQLFHRGGYSNGSAQRTIFHMEFSNPEKHKVSRGPIGSKTFNSFDFDSQLLDISSFRSLLDPNRLHIIEKTCRYGITR